MATEENETTVNESFSVTVPADVRDEIDLEPGDRLRWDVTDDGRLLVEVVRERYGVAEDLDPIEVDEVTDAVEETETSAYRID